MVDTTRAMLIRHLDPARRVSIADARRQGLVQLDAKYILVHRWEGITLDQIFSRSLSGHHD
jgi:hypothetical protein